LYDTPFSHFIRIRFFIFFLRRALWFVETGTLKLNEFGDLLAGVASAIAVIWFVISAITQQRELSDQREDIEGTK
jgi:hypothetical protein